LGVLISTDAAALADNHVFTKTLYQSYRPPDERSVGSPTGPMPFWFYGHRVRNSPARDNCFVFEVAIWLTQTTIDSCDSEMVK